MVKVKVVVVVLSAFFILSEAAVTVEVLSGLSTVRTVECGKQGIIRCVVSPFPGTAGYMAWTTDSKSLTQCFDASDDDCSPLSVDHYQFTSKLTDETFNLTFNTVKLSDGSVEFRCTDTINTASVTPLVKVVPDNASTTHSSSGLELEVTTGCVYPESAITFKWYYMKNGSPVVFGNSKSEETVDSTSCTNVDCGGTDVKKITSRLTTDSEGDEYNIYVDIIHDDVPENDPNYVVSKSFGMFKVAIATTVTDAPTTAPTPGELEWWKYLLIAIGATIGFLFLIGIILGIIICCPICCSESFLNQDNCVDNCYCKYECCASTPCGACCNIEGLPSWYKVLWASIIGIPVALGILLVWKCCGHANERGRNDSTNNSSGDVPLNTKYSN